MGTHCITHFYDNDGGCIIATLYRQHDGDPERHGVELAKAIGNRVVVNGFTNGDNEFNGAGDLAVRVITALKGDANKAGNFYLLPPPKDRESSVVISEEYNYHVNCKTGENPKIYVYDINGMLRYYSKAKDFNTLLEDDKKTADLNGLSVVSYANGFSQWHYRNRKHSISDIKSDGYFNKASKRLCKGDFMIIDCDRSSSLAFVQESSENGVTLRVVIQNDW